MNLAKPQKYLILKLVTLLLAFAGVIWLMLLLRTPPAESPGIPAKVQIDSPPPSHQ